MQQQTHLYISDFYTSRSFPRSWLITGFVTRLTRRVSLVEQELLTLPEHLSSPTDISRVRVTRSLALYACFVARCSSSIYGFWLPLWYLQTLFAQHDLRAGFLLMRLLFIASMPSSSVRTILLWREGYFYFHKISIRLIARCERWCRILENSIRFIHVNRP